MKRCGQDGCHDMQLPGINTPPVTYCMSTISEPSTASQLQHYYILYFE